MKHTNKRHCKYFDSIADLYADKIEQLLKNGYRDVFLVTDHGFVLQRFRESMIKLMLTLNKKFIKVKGISEL